VSRVHRIEVNRKERRVSIGGGKLTTYRFMAADCLNKLESLAKDANIRQPLRPCTTKTRPLPGCVGINSDRDMDGLIQQVESDYGISEDIATHLVETYGMRCRFVLEHCLSQSVTQAIARQLPELPFLVGEEEFSRQYELALTTEDHRFRRSTLGTRSPSL